MLVLGSFAHADDAKQFDVMIQNIHAHRAQMEAQLGLDPDWYRLPRATSYYDDKVAHYELAQLMSDQIDAGINWDGINWDSWNY